MSEAESLPDQEIVRAAWGHADVGGNDRQTRIIYAAGFFDGEGWISISTHKRSQPVLFIGAGQLVAAPLALLQGLWGGAIIGPDPHGMHRWRVQSGRASLALSEMLPFLIVKRSQAEVGLSFQDQREGRPKRHEDDKERGRVNMARHRARERGLDIETPPRPSLSPAAWENATRFREALWATRP